MNKFIRFVISAFFFVGSTVSLIMMWSILAFVNHGEGYRPEYDIALTGLFVGFAASLFATAVLGINSVANKKFMGIDIKD